MREELAAYAHEAWAGWMKYLFNKSDCFDFHFCGGGVFIPRGSAERWMHQMNTAYQDLSEDEKASDRAEADKMLSLMSKLTGLELGE